MVSVDVEDWYHHLRVTGESYSTYDSVETFFDEWSGRYDYLSDPVDRVLDLLDEFGIKATFFVVGDVVDNYPGLVEKISGRGHNIGCHGLHHTTVVDPDSREAKFTREEFSDRVQTAREKLESASGQNVVGYRAPNAYVTGWMLDELEDLGFRYDSSVSRNSLYNKTDAELDKIDSTPYVPQYGDLTPGGERPFVEFAWPYYKLGPIRIPTAGGSLVRLFGRRVLSKGLRQSLERGPTVFYFHPLEICRESLPDIGNSRRRPGYWMFKGETAERRIRRILDDMGDARIATHEDVLQRLSGIDSGHEAITGGSLYEG